MRLLYLFCSAGGSSKGFYDAGFKDITGVDIEPQPRYPYKFVQADAIEFVGKYGKEFDFIAASPPCQHYNSLSKLNYRLHGKSYPDLIAITRKALELTGRPYVIENVAGARKHLTDPVMLCGTFFGLKVYRHRLFECHPSITHLQPRHFPHNDKSPGCSGDRTSPKGFITVCGGKGGGFKLAPASKAMGIDWMTRKELAQAIPPVYTNWIGEKMLEQLKPKLVVAGTGHRPDRLGGYSDKIILDITLMLIDYLEEKQATHVITGMALGFDTALCLAGLELGLHVTAAVPFKGQESKWNLQDQHRYRCLLEQCNSVHIVSSGEYSGYKMRLRNEWMVDRCDHLVALWDGVPNSSGTGGTVNYAQRKGKPYDNLWQKWIARK